jgi:hypothetical protein
LKCISTCQLKRYVSRTSSALTECGSDETITMNALKAAVFPVTCCLCGMPVAPAFSGIAHTLPALSA